MELFNLVLGQLIEDLIVIKEQKVPFSALEKDVVLQILRDNYLQICKMEPEKEENVPELQPEIPQPEILQPEVPHPEILQPEILQPEPQSLEPVTPEPVVVATQHFDPQPELFTTPPVPITPVIAKNPLLQEVKSEIPEIPDTPEEIPNTPNTPDTPPLTPPPIEIPTASVSTEKRSLNDLLTTQKEDLGSKFQQSKIEDLTKAISLNDKFVYIKELFKNRGEEFSKAIQTLNNCRTMDEAFAELERLKNYYFWDSSQPAYLSLCELIRRKYF
jgi:hypothetical protein